MERNVAVTAGTLMVGASLFFGPSFLTFGVFLDDLRIVQGLGGTLILASILYGTPLKVLSVLDHAVVTFYGRISYSFYLLHDLVLIVVFRVFIYKAPPQLWASYPLLWAAILWLVSTLFATAIASLSFSRIEKPLIEISKRICLRIATRPILCQSPFTQVQSLKPEINSR